MYVGSSTYPSFRIRVNAILELNSKQVEFVVELINLRIKWTILLNKDRNNELTLNGSSSGPKLFSGLQLEKIKSMRESPESVVIDQISDRREHVDKDTTYSL